MVDIYWGDGQKLSPQSGKLKGTLGIRDKVLVDQLTGLNTLASGLITQVNAIHRTGFGLNNVTNLDFFKGSNASDIAVNNSLDNASIATSSGTNQPGNSTVALQIAALKTLKGMKGGTATLNEVYNSQVTEFGVIIQHAGDNFYQHGLVEKALGDQREICHGGQFG